jgi:transmembrane sensor
MNNELLQTLLDDQRFVEWVQSDFQIHDDYWSQFIDNQPDNHEIINQAIRTVMALQGDKFIYEDKNRLFTRIEKSINNLSSVENKSKVISMQRWMAYAASLIFLLVSLVYFGGNKTVNTGVGDSLVVELPDDSKVSLNANTSITYHRILWFFSRNINLSGEAFFEVTKGSTFTVNTSAGDVTVLGTSFNVDNFNDKLDVRCYSGKVSVIGSTKSNSVVLTPGKGVIMNQSPRAILFDVEEQNKPEWKEGREDFENVSLLEVVREIQKYFDYTIEVEKNCENLKINASVPVKDLDSALQTITWPLELKFKIQNNKVLISK